MCCTWLYCPLLYCTLPLQNFTVLFCTVLYRYRTLMCCSVLYCAVPYCLHLWWQPVSCACSLMSVFSTAAELHCTRVHGTRYTLLNTLNREHSKLFMVHYTQYTTHNTLLWSLLYTCTGLKSLGLPKLGSTLHCTLHCTIHCTHSNVERN